MLPTTQAVIQQLEDERKRKERLEWYLGQVLLEKQHLGLPSPASPPLDNLFLSPACPDLEVMTGGTTAIAAAAIPSRTAQPVRRASSSPALSKVEEDDQDQPGRTKGKGSARRRTPPMRSISKGNDTQHTAKQLKRLLRNKEKKQNSSGVTPWARKDTPTPTTNNNNKLNSWQQQRTKALRPIVEEAAPYMVKSYISLVDATPQRPSTSTVYHQEPIPTIHVSPPRVEEEEELELGYVMLDQQQLQTGTADSWTRLWQQQQQLAASGSEKEQQIQGHSFEQDVQLQLDLERFNLLEEESSSGLSSEEEDKVLASLWEESGTWSKDWTLWTDDVEHLYAPPTMDSSFFSSVSSFGSQTIS
ncbi:hypothetical protein QOT17_018379 [Balamuthia mandrillaris]